jgi:glycosyltransferase involved in cell wall biosynthesis
MVTVCVDKVGSDQWSHSSVRVLHVIPSVSERSGGPATAIFPMCRALQTRGVEVMLVTTNDGIETEASRVTEHQGVPTMFFPCQFGGSFKYSRPLAAWLHSQIRGFNLLHIHAVFNHACIAAARACRQSQVPYIVRPLGTLHPWSMKQKRVRKRLFWLVRGKAMLTGAEAIHYTAQAEKVATEGLLGLNHGTVIPLGIDANEASSNGSALHFPYPYLLVLSRLHPKKGLDVLIEAFAELAREPKFARWRLVVAGDGPTDYVEQLKRQAALASDKIVFPGWLDGERKEAALRRASLLALPSHQENFGLCVMEALAHSVPVLISPHVSLADEIETAGAGWIARVEKDALKTRLAEALTDEEELSRRGRAGKTLSENYSWERVADSLIELYKSSLR